MNFSSTGACQCGVVRFGTTGAPKFVSNCHCVSCRKATGAAFSTWVGFDDNNVHWLTGEPAYYASSNGVKRGFCNACGAPMTYAGDQWPGETHILIGMFNDPLAFVPRRDVFTEDALPWAMSGKEQA